MSIEWLEVEIAEKWLEAEDAFGLTLVDMRGGNLPPFTAGSHIDVQVGEKLVRQYSLFNPPGERHRYQICVARNSQSRGGSAAIADALREGDTLHVSRPRNNFELESGAGEYLLLAGGIGITPILCMAEQLSQDGRAFELHYCCRSDKRAPLIGHLKNEKFADRVNFHFDGGLPDRQIDIDKLLRAKHRDTKLYVCGPRGMIEAARTAAERAGWDSSCVHYEAFTADLDAAKSGSEFHICLARSGTELVVPPGLSIAQVLSKNGIEVPLSCEQGICGTCVIQVLDGIPDHRDSYFTRREREANKAITVCCSRSVTRSLTLDI